MSIPLCRLSRFAALWLLTTSAAFGQKPGPQVDLLTRPSAVTQRSATSVMLAVASAGPRVVAVGERGIVLLSDDLGKTWRQTGLPVSVALTAVQFVDARLGWAVGHGGVVLHSTDGGVSWSKQLDGAQAAQIELASARRDGDARRLRDAERMLAEGADKPLLDVLFGDADNGVVVGAYGLAFATHDGGKTWQSLRGQIDNPRGRHLYSIHAAGKQLYLAGEQGALYRSDDNAQTFREVPTPYAGSYFGIVSADNGALVLFGLRGNAYRSTDLGANWKKIDTGLPITLTAGKRLASGALLLVDESGRMLRSLDDGATFAAVPVTLRAAFTGITQAADGSVVLAGMRGPSRIAIETVLGSDKK